MESPSRFQAFIESSATSRRIPIIILVDGNGDVITQSQAAAQGGIPPIPPEALAEAKQGNGQPVLIAPGMTPEAAVIGGIAELSGYADVFLYVIRKVDPDVVQYISATEATSTGHATTSLRKTASSVRPPGPKSGRARS